MNTIRRLEDLCNTDDRYRSEFFSDPVGVLRREGINISANYEQRIINLFEIIGGKCNAGFGTDNSPQIIAMSSQGGVHKIR